MSLVLLRAWHEPSASLRDQALVGELLAEFEQLLVAQRGEGRGGCEAEGSGYQVGCRHKVGRWPFESSCFGGGLGGFQFESMDSGMFGGRPLHLGDPPSIDIVEGAVSYQEEELSVIRLEKSLDPAHGRDVSPLSIFQNEGTAGEVIESEVLSDTVYRAAERLRAINLAVDVHITCNAFDDRSCGAAF